jgi:hypothetical protein
MGLGKEYGMRAVRDLISDLLAPMRGKAVHNNRILFGQGDQLLVDLERRENLSPLLGFFA